MGRIISLLAAVLLLGLWASPAVALDPKPGVDAGTNPDVWAKQQTDAHPNWEVTKKISPAMSQILGDVLIAFGNYDPKGNVCNAAAAGQAWQALADAANSGPLEGFLDAIKGAISGIKNIATFGADPEAAADMLDAQALVKKAFDDAKDMAEDKAKETLKEKLKEIWNGKKVEVLERHGDHGACSTELLATWDEGAGTYEIVIYGFCDCAPVGGWAVGSTGTSLRSYAVTLTGTVTASVKDGAGVYIIGQPKVTVYASCGCGGKDSHTAHGPGPVITDGPVGPPLPPPPPSTYDGWGKITTTCPACQPIVNEIKAAQAARDALTRQINQADDETRNAARRLAEASAAQKPAAKAEYDADKAVSDDLTMRDAGLILLEQKLWEKLKQCEKNCGHASSGVCPNPGGQYALAPGAASSTNVSMASAVLADINAARADPQAYAVGLKKFEANYHGKELDQPGHPRAMTIEGVAAVDNAIAYLGQLMPVDALQPSAALTASATRLVVDLAPKGKVGHTGSDGSSMRDRIQGAGVYAAAMEEDETLAQTTAVDVVRSLIIDDGVDSRGHRTVLFDPGLSIVGVSCGGHTKYAIMCVIDFAGGLKCAPGAESGGAAAASGENELRTKRLGPSPLEGEGGGEADG